MHKIIIALLLLFLYCYLSVLGLFKNNNFFNDSIIVSLKNALFLKSPRERSDEILLLRCKPEEYNDALYK